MHLPCARHCIDPWGMASPNSLSGKLHEVKDCGGLVHPQAASTMLTTRKVSDTNLDGWRDRVGGRMDVYYYLQQLRVQWASKLDSQRHRSGNLVTGPHSVSEPFLLCEQADLPLWFSFTHL